MKSTEAVTKLLVGTMLVLVAEPEFL